MSSLRELSCKSSSFSEESKSPTVSPSSESFTPPETPAIINKLLSVFKNFSWCNVENICAEGKLASPPLDTRSTRLFEHPFQTAEYYALNLLRNDHFDRFHNLSKYQIINYIRKLFKVPNDIRIQDLGCGCEVFVFKVAYQRRHSAVKIIYNKKNIRKLDQLKDQSHLCLNNIEGLNHIIKPKAYILLDNAGNG